MAPMRHASIKLLLALIASGLGAAAVAGCGNDVPPNAVAKVGDQTITQDEFTKWLSAGVKQQAQGGTAVVPDPPGFTKCVASKKKVPAPEGQAKQTDAQLKKQCKTEYETLKSEVMQYLIQAEWVEQEARKQGIKVSDKAVRKELEAQKKQAFPNEKAYQRFLKTSGMSEADILFRVKLDQLQRKLTEKVTKDAKKVTGSDIEEYYDKNKKRFAAPEQRDLLVVVTKTQAKAQAARRALAGGQPWKSVANQYSIDKASKAQGGKLPAIAKGQQGDKSLDDAIFKARKGQLEGPVETQFGWYVFEVDKITPASQQSLEQARNTVKNLLQSERQQKAIDAFIKDFRERYKGDTQCADDYRVAECDNAPKKSSDTGPASGGGPNGQSEPPRPSQPSQPQPENPNQ
jgi:foldase protein PrsA